MEEEALSVAELNARFQLKMEKKVAEAAKDNVRRMAAMREELWASNAKTNVILAMLSRLICSRKAPPFVLTPPRSVPSLPLPCTTCLPWGSFSGINAHNHADDHPTIHSYGATPAGSVNSNVRSPILMNGRL